MDQVPIVRRVPPHRQQEPTLRNVPPRGSDVADAQGGKNENPEVVEVNMETIDNVIAEMRMFKCRNLETGELESCNAIAYYYANRIEAAAKREADSIHRAMVLIAGIEMEDSENPPRLRTALEDAYDALGTDGDTTADVEEAKAIGRHFVVKPVGNAAERDIEEVIADLRDSEVNNG